jgi:hypothetical protein
VPLTPTSLLDSRACHRPHLTAESLCASLTLHLGFEGGEEKRLQPLPTTATVASLSWLSPPLKTMCALVSY